MRINVFVMILSLLSAGAQSQEITHPVDGPQLILDWNKSNTGTDQEIQFKSSMTQENLLDSVYYFTWFDPVNLYFLDRKVVYAYDEHGNPVQEEQFKYEASTWVNESLILNTYQDDRLITENRLKWDGSQYINTVKYSFTLNDSGNVLSRLYQRWENGTWVNSSERLSDYDKDQNLLLELSRRWENGAWLNIWRIQRQYDAAGRLTHYRRQNWSGSWINEFATSNSYDVDDQVNSSLSYEWDGQIWRRRSKGENFFDDDRKFTGSESFEWNNEWVKSRKLVNFFDTNKFVVRQLQMKGSGNDWVNDWQYEYTLNSNGEMTDWVWQPWDGIQFQDNLRGHRDFNSDRRVVLNNYEIYDGNTWGEGQQRRYSFTNNGLLRTRSLQEKSGLGWQELDSVYYFYRGLPTGVDHVDHTSKILVYPNPGREQIIIDLEVKLGTSYHLRLFDAMGRQVREEKVLQFPYTLGRRSLTSGNYYFQIQDSEGAAHSGVVVFE